jgi:glycosyltransferase involved in cell wall biosynthesis
MTHDAPQVSICIPVYNGESFLLEAVESALKQTFHDFEVVIVDNASTDGTQFIVEEIASDNRRIRFFRNDTNIGIVGNFNACLRHACGKYIKFLCADDLLLPTCLEDMVRELDTNPFVSLVVGGRLIVDENGQRVDERSYAKTETIISGVSVINRCLFGANYIGEPSAVMFQREMAMRGFREDLSHLMDLEMWFYLLEKGDLVNLPAPLCAIRHHVGQMTIQSIKSGVLVENNVRLFEDYGKKPYIYNSWVNRTSRRFRMAYRVWISRQYLDPLRKREILREYSSPLVYCLLMPVLSGLLSSLRNISLLRIKNR